MVAAGTRPQSKKTTPADGTPDLRRISEHDRDYTRLHARTVRLLTASLRQLVRDLRASHAAHEETAILSAFIHRHTALLREAYTAAHGEGVRDYYDGVSRQPARWAKVAIASGTATPDDTTLVRRLSFYAPSVAKMAHEALLAWHEEKRRKSQPRVLREAEAIAARASTATDSRTNEASESSIQLMGGHQPGYQQNRGPGGKFAPGNGRDEDEESGGGSGDNGGAGRIGSGRTARGGSGDNGGGRSGAGKANQDVMNTSAQGAKTSRVPHVKPEPDQPPYPHIAHDADGNPIKGKGGNAQERLKVAQEHAAKAEVAMRQAHESRVPSSHPEHEARELVYYKALLDHGTAKIELDQATEAAHAEQHAASRNERQARIEQVNARRTELDTKFGPYSEARAEKQMQRLYDDHPELKQAFTEHIAGEQGNLTAEHVADLAVRNLRGYVSYADEQEAIAHAHEGFQRMREISEWSLLHSSHVTSEGTIQLYRGERGRNSDETSRQRLESSATRRGTSWTTDRGIAERFDGGRVIEAHVPVEHILTWHGIQRGMSFDREAEYTVGTGRISDYTIHPGTGTGK